MPKMPNHNHLSLVSCQRVLGPMHAKGPSARKTQWPPSGRPPLCQLFAASFEGVSRRVHRALGSALECSGRGAAAHEPRQPPDLALYFGLFRPTKCHDSSRAGFVRKAKRNYGMRNYGRNYA